MQKTEVRILTADPISKMTGYPSFELTEAKSDQISELGSETFVYPCNFYLLGKSVFASAKKKLKVVII